ncbi:23S ribosomal RNA methyltransferase Erm [Bacillus sonorensis]|uniref:23S ribosomal RNA methyltransferase Erm n=1 Tax=Bacillus sonorensis TaxID=119858 RepID=UPI001F21A46C|nr:23S ribosomal RNA methyltransferase Erm [Bacillus sonorensis]MCF7619305.1 23S ribosomal RNA methyltransferase Erm [Bacillus sonorensis]MCY7855668.1 23S ribosomal RNA methyltransferase Erm [Bacillus sonorensis]MCY8032543.1 23S ribosomal RNA methyltransferase Erm [Bacillus sonorensis]MCY8087227.1 23S ribosomal RNA methyltransferase Erm [Bacillus sonorensis]MCY8405263.1 23S ribosomal RNA methyltransferase Erm [Bacillus sonorensis]
MTKRRKKYQNRKFTAANPPNFSGQHLIHNKGLLKDIVNIAHISESDLVLELGAGKGAITNVLSSRARKVLAVENDQKFIKKLKQLEMKNTVIIEQDILKISLPREHFLVVSNIPYAITTPIMKMLLNNPSSGFQRGVIVMEKGAAKRFTSNFVKDPYIIAWKMWFDIRYVKGITRKNFSPPPKVDSAMITINRKADPIVPISDSLIFWGLADYVLKNPQISIDLALRGVFTPPQIKHLKRNLRIKDEDPVATLSEQQWGFIFETMLKHVPKFRWPKIKKAKLNHF